MGEQVRDEREQAAVEAVVPYLDNIAEAGAADRLGDRNCEEDAERIVRLVREALAVRPDREALIEQLRMAADDRRHDQLSTRLVGLLREAADALAGAAPEGLPAEPSEEAQIAALRHHGVTPENRHQYPETVLQVLAGIEAAYRIDASTGLTLTYEQGWEALEAIHDALRTSPPMRNWTAVRERLKGACDALEAWLPEGTEPDWRDHQPRDASTGEPEADEFVGAGCCPEEDDYLRARAAGWHTSTGERPEHGGDPSGGYDSAYCNDGPVGERPVAAERRGDGLFRTGERDASPPERIPHGFWRALPCGHPPDPVAVWFDGEPVCHCGDRLRLDEALPIKPPEAPGPIVPCGKCGCHVAVPPNEPDPPPDQQGEGEPGPDRALQRAVDDLARTSRPVREWARALGIEDMDRFSVPQVMGRVRETVERELAEVRAGAESLDRDYAAANREIDRLTDLLREARAKIERLRERESRDMRGALAKVERLQREIERLRAAKPLSTDLLRDPPDWLVKAAREHFAKQGGFVPSAPKTRSLLVALADALVAHQEEARDGE